MHPFHQTRLLMNAAARWAGKATKDNLGRFADYDARLVLPRANQQLWCDLYGMNWVSSRLAPFSADYRSLTLIAPQLVVGCAHCGRPDMATFVTQSGGLYEARISHHQTVGKEGKTWSSDAYLGLLSSPVPRHIIQPAILLQLGTVSPVEQSDGDDFFPCFLHLLGGKFVKAASVAYHDYYEGKMLQTITDDSSEAWKQNGYGIDDKVGGWSASQMFVVTNYGAMLLGHLSWRGSKDEDGDGKNEATGMGCAYHNFDWEDEILALEAAAGVAHGSVTRPTFTPYIKP